MAREIIGTMTCPECGGAAEVKRQKNGLAYRWCLDCHAQYFPRSADASDRLVAKCGGTVKVPAPAAKPEPKPEPKPKPAAKAAAKPAPDQAPAPAVAAPAPAPRRSAGPFDFLMK